MERKKVFSIKIEVNGSALHMKGENCEVDMIPFQGYVESKLFNGRIESCGVDTQIVNAVSVRHLSARYMLTGIDFEGKEAHIYVENNGWIDDRSMTMPFHTVPTFYTDSEALAPYLHSTRFVGEGVQEKDGLWIYFYDIAGGEAD